MAAPEEPHVDAGAPDDEFAPPTHDAAHAVDEAPEQIYTPEPWEKQLSVRAILAGCVLGSVVAAMNLYLGLRTGWSLGGSLIAAILGFAIMGGITSALRRAKARSLSD